MRACVRFRMLACIGDFMSKRGLYFKYLRNEQNEEIDYQYHAPKYGASNTDISYYEPNSTRIANMYRSASAASTGVYDFDDGKERKIEDCVVFEDSFHGLQAGRDAKMKVVGLATTNPKETIIDKSDIVIEDFSNFTIENFVNFAIS